MILTTLARALALTAIVAAPASGQTSTLDQVSPDTGETFYAGTSNIVWQQQVRVGVEGRLEALEMTFSGPVGAKVRVRIRMAAGWTQTPHVWTTIFTSQNLADQLPRFNLLGAAIDVVPGDVFVVEVQGDGSGMSTAGSYVDPGQGAPEYPEPLFLGGPGCYADCGWRIAFKTWVLVPDTDGNYCSVNANSTGSPALMSYSGSKSVSANNFTLEARPVPNQPGLFFYGANQVEVVFGNGFRCVGGQIFRRPVFVPQNNEMVQYYDLTNPPSQAGAITAGSVWNFQAWFRDPAGGGASYNLSDGYQVTFEP